MTILDTLGIDTARLDTEVRLAETEIDVRDMAEVARAVSEHYGARVEESDLKGAETLRDAIEAMRRKLP